MLHRDIYILLGLRARCCIILLGRRRGMSLRTTSEDDELCLTLPCSWKGSQVLVKVSTQCLLELENFCICLLSTRELKAHKLKFLVENSSLNFFSYLTGHQQSSSKPKQRGGLRIKENIFLIAFLSLESCFIVTFLKALVFYNNFGWKERYKIGFARGVDWFIRNTIVQLPC